MLRDAEQHEFVKDTFVRRIPAIMDDTIRRLEIAEPSAAWKTLKSILVGGCEEMIFQLVARPENHEWREDLLSCIRSGKTFLDVDTFFLENLIYRYMLDSIAYWDSGKDPFRLHKREALDKALEGPFHNVAKACAGNYEDGLNFEAFRKLLLYDLWGNRADLSLSAGQVSESDDKGANFLLADDSAKIWGANDIIDSGAARGRRIAFVLDNCGLELCTDLLLAEVF